MTLLATTIKLTDWLTLNLRHSMDYYSDINEGRLAYGQRYNEPTGNYGQDRTTSRTQNADYLLSGYKRFGKTGVKLSLGGSRFDLNNSGISGSNNGNLVPDFYNLGIPPAVIVRKFSATEYKFEKVDGSRKPTLDHSNAWLTKVPIVRETKE